MPHPPRPCVTEGLPSVLALVTANPYTIKAASIERFD